MKKVLIAMVGLAVLVFAGVAFAGGPGCCAGKASATKASAAACETKAGEVSACVMKTVKLSIDGMHCPNCREAVQAALTGLDGVSAAKVSYTRKKAEVTYNAAAVSEESIVKAVNATGFMVMEVKTADGKTSADCCKEGAKAESASSKADCCKAAKAAKKSGT